LVARGGVPLFSSSPSSLPVNKLQNKEKRGKEKEKIGREEDKREMPLSKKKDSHREIPFCFFFLFSSSYPLFWEE
jgi:hypothetical protein